MSAAVRAGFFYFLIVFAAGILLGALRIYLIAPLVGGVLAGLLELPVILAIAWTVSRTLIDRFGVPRQWREAAVVGALALVLLLIAEIGVSALLGRNMVEHLELYRAASGLLGLTGQIAYGLFPVIQVQLARGRRR